MVTCLETSKEAIGDVKVEETMRKIDRVREVKQRKVVDLDESRRKGEIYT